MGKKIPNFSANFKYSSRHTVIPEVHNSMRPMGEVQCQKVHSGCEDPPSRPGSVTGTPEESSTDYIQQDSTSEGRHEYRDSFKKVPKEEEMMYAEYSQNETSSRFMELFYFTQTTQLFSQLQCFLTVARKPWAWPSRCSSTS